jgi:hypothetical protein
MSEESLKIRRKRTTSPAPVEDAPVVPAEVPPPQLTQRELYELRLAEVELRAAHNLAEVARMKRLYVLALIDPKGRVAAAEKERESALASASEARKKYEQVKHAAFARLGIKPSNIAGFDADTGLIIFPDSARG